MSKASPIRTLIPPEKGVERPVTSLRDEQTVTSRNTQQTKPMKMTESNRNTPRRKREEEMNTQ